MLFKIHYFAFNAGLSGVLVLITVFLRKYSDASSTEVGTLLMILPFVAVFTKPFFCALADRHRRYRLYFVLSLVFTLLGFGSYTLLPFFPELVATPGRTAWYLLAAATVLGYISYGVAWSLGDALAANVSHQTGESFGLIRLWGTVGWGVAGAVVGGLSPHVRLPEMVLGLLLFVGAFLFEIGLLCWWPRACDFEMGDCEGPADPSQRPVAIMTEKPTSWKQKPASREQQAAEEGELVLALSQLDELSIRRTKSNALALTAKLRPLSDSHQRQKLALDSLDRTIDELMARSVATLSGPEEARECQRRQVAAIQTTILAMVARRHKSLLKYLLLFVALGAVYNMHWSYFFLHLDQLAQQGKAGSDFSTLVGMCLVAQAVGETFCFAIAPAVLRKLGRDGAISLNAAAYVLRYFGNGLGIPLLSPYVAVITESLQGINYGIFYYLITDTALHYALLVDELIPELLERGLIDAGTDLKLVRTSLRATMQGLFSGAFDGLGFGLGSLVAGLVLERHQYEQLWCLAGAGAFVIFLLHAVYELANRYWRWRHLRKAGSPTSAPHETEIK